MAYYSVIKRKKLLIVNNMIESQIMLSKRSQTEKRTCWWLYLFEVLEHTKLIHNYRNQISDFVGNRMMVDSEGLSGNNLEWWKCSIFWLGWWLYRCICLSNTLNCSLKMGAFYCFNCILKNVKNRHNLSMMIKLRIVVTIVRRGGG